MRLTRLQPTRCLVALICISEILFYFCRSENPKKKHSKHASLQPEKSKHGKKSRKKSKKSKKNKKESYKSESETDIVSLNEIDLSKQR